MFESSDTIVANDVMGFTPTEFSLECQQKKQDCNHLLLCKTFLLRQEKNHIAHTWCVDYVGYCQDAGVNCGHHKLTCKLKLTENFASKLHDFENTWCMLKWTNEKSNQQQQLEFQSSQQFRMLLCWKTKVFLIFFFSVFLPILRPEKENDADAWLLFCWRDSFFLLFLSFLDLTSNDQEKECWGLLPMTPSHHCTLLQWSELAGCLGGIIGHCANKES